MSYVIAIAAPIGGGKTALTNALAMALGNAPTIYFDHYERATESSITDLQEWMKKGADFNEIMAPNLSKDLATLKRGECITDPLTHAEIKPGKYIIFEAPLGREQRDTAQLIDLLVWVEVPLDVALARKVRELAGKNIGNSHNFLLWLDGYLKNYLEVVRHVLLLQKQKVRVNADLVIDGEVRLENMVRQIIDRIASRYG
jgi:uridine kinase